MRFWHCLFFSVCSISLTKYQLYASVMLSIYAKLSSHLLTVRKRESTCTHARNCVFTIYSKIENSSYYQELVSHSIPMCWWIGLNKTPASFPWQQLTKHAACRSMFLSVVLQILDVLFIWRIWISMAGFPRQPFSLCRICKICRALSTLRVMNGNTKFSIHLLYIREDCPTYHRNLDTYL